jgi:hypothetical protein
LRPECWLLLALALLPWHTIEHRLAWRDNPNVKVGNVQEKDDDTIVAEIITQNGSLVQKFEVNRHTGWMRPAQ